jgi:NADH-quinone oxidoreductase subunit A
VIGDFLEPWLPFLIYGIFALLIPASLIFASYKLATRPARRSRARTLPFESGVSQGPPQQQRFTVSFYLTAMLFIVFDIEIVFLYPWAVSFDQMGTFALVEMVLFIATVFIAYFYVLRRGGLEWD